MSLFKSLSEQFFEKSTVKLSSEDFDVLHVQYQGYTLNLPQKDALIESLSFCQNEDTWKLFLKIGDSEEVQFTINDDYNEFSKNVSVKLTGLESDDDILLNLKIFKRSDRKEVTIYSIELFDEYLNLLTVEERFDIISQRITKNGLIIFTINSLPETYISSGIVLTSHGFNSNIDIDSRLNWKKSIQSVTHSSIFSKFNIIPQDFIFDTTIPPLQLVLTLNKLAFVSFVCSIFDYTNLSENHLEFKLQGYKSIVGNINLNDLNANKNLHEYHNIYKWIFGSGNTIDKIGLARNILSLHILNPSTLNFDQSAYHSILSAYKVYEKQNIKQYIDLRNKMSEQLLDYGKRANQIIESFASGFQRSSLAAITFFGSTLALRVLASHNTSLDFVIYSSILSLIFVLFSLAYMFVARWEVTKQKERFNNTYLNFKNRYTDLLTKEDIDQILKNDQEHKNDMLFIDEKLKNYTWLWVSVLVMLTIFIVVFFLYQSTQTNITTAISNMLT